MRAVGLVEAVRDGRLVRYRLVDEEIEAACGLMREVLVRRLTRLGDLAATAHAVPTSTTSTFPTSTIPTSTIPTSTIPTHPNEGSPR
jgi:hypothetical protein